MDALSATIMDIVTDPGTTPFRATAALHAAGAPADWRVRELCDRRLWVAMGSEWAILSELAESVA